MSIFFYQKFSQLWCVYCMANILFPIFHHRKTFWSVDPMAICSLLSLTITFQSFFQPQPQSSVLLLFLGGLLKILTFPLSNVAIHSPGARKNHIWSLRIYFHWLPQPCFICKKSNCAVDEKFLYSL